MTARSSASRGTFCGAGGVVRIIARFVVRLGIASGSTEMEEGCREIGGVSKVPPEPENPGGTGAYGWIG